MQTSGLPVIVFYPKKLMLPLLSFDLQLSTTRFPDDRAISVRMLRVPMNLKGVPKTPAYFSQV